MCVYVSMRGREREARERKIRKNKKNYNSVTMREAFKTESDFMLVILLKGK